ncbi:RND superfamily NFE family efflux transporter inner membrane pump subunit [Oleiphilus messinensis]|uniref:RND superfamily NFE family efflux transporter inner membrane pump subunit n=1 Tax=Oleiphilus messinensis TaxID=141451 RepID=A0A1Y0IFH3_9GAMM|nr:efflux RND transporter permease subunit [Oleiphilus messinensis]ARU58245.1 RND superfamily NFE family efflux transporter inner membrane pump subunit [Oleiphilus messinensis]
MIRFFAGHPTAGNLLMVLFLALGLMSLPNIQRETFPEIAQNEVRVSVPYKGATPGDVESGVCKPLEDAVDGISFILETRCEARHSIGVMTLEMQGDGSFPQFLDDVKSAVDAINNFPESSELPVIEELGRTQNVVTLALMADLPRTELKTLAEAVKQRMLRETNVPLVEIKGFSDRRLSIKVPHYNLRQFGLSLQDIARIIGQQNVDMPAGDLTVADKEYQIRLNDEKRSIATLGDLIVIRGARGAEVRLRDIAIIEQGFEVEEDQVSFNGQPAAFLTVLKNSRDDSLNILDEVKVFLDAEQARLPPQVKLELTQDFTSIIQDRINMLGTNAWQGLVLVFLVMWLFFGTRYAFWVVMGLPVSFLASAFVLSHLGVTINMLSLVALLLALGILMDDAIVISESIGSQLKLGKEPLDAVIDGTMQVAQGVFSSFLTTLCVFTGLLALKGDIGQILVVIPIVLISVITVSLIEAFFILPNHLFHSLSHRARGSEGAFRVWFDARFERSRVMLDRWVARLIRIRYGFVGGVMGLLIISVSLLLSGVVKFSPFPNVEGDILQARLIMPTGTSLQRTDAVIQQLVDDLRSVAKPLESRQGEPVLKAITVQYGQNIDAFETGPHVATISVDLLTAELRNFSMVELQRAWLAKAQQIRGPWSIVIKEPTIGPAGRAIEIQIQGDNLDQLAQAAHDLQRWLNGYPGVSNLLADLRPGKPEFTLHLTEGAYSLGVNAETIGAQLRAAFQGVSVLETYVGLESFDLVVTLSEGAKANLADFDNFPIIHPGTGATIPLSQVAEVVPTRSYSRIHRIDGQRTLTVLGDIDRRLNNTGEVLRDVEARFMPDLRTKYPDLSISFKGEVAEGAETQGSMKVAFLLGMLGIFLLLSFQFRSYVEPFMVMVNIPLALIGVIWGHWLLGLDLTMPSLLGFVSLAGVVVNDSILLVEFVKRRIRSGMSVHEAAAKASHDRYRAVLLTSLTTVAGMTPLLFESSLQAQVLIPLATSIVFGMVSSTILVLFVVPCLYCILEDFGWAKAHSQKAVKASST